MSEFFQHGDAETRRKLVHEDLTQLIIGAAIEVHRELGPGLLESAYAECLCRELSLRGLRFTREVPLHVEYKGTKLDCGYRIDILVDERVILELKCVEQILRVHEAQLLTYLRLSGHPVGFIFNFFTENLSRGGMVRKVLEKSLRASAPPRSE